MGERGAACPQMAFPRWDKRVGARRGLWIPTAVRMTRVGVPAKGVIAPSARGVGVWNFVAAGETGVGAAGNGDGRRTACPQMAFPRWHRRVGARRGLWITAAARMTGGMVGGWRVVARWLVGKDAGRSPAGLGWGCGALRAKRSHTSAGGVAWR